MPLKVYTSQYRYSGPDRLDITAKGNDPFGIHFAPTWSMVEGYKSGRISKREYLETYHGLMEWSYKTVVPWAWKSLLDRSRVVLVCFCPPGEFCHRLILQEILVALGAERGEEIV